MLNLLLQKSLRVSKQILSKSIKKRIQLWVSREIIELFKEVETIYKCPKAISATSTTNVISNKFKREMREDNVHNAMKLHQIDAENIGKATTKIKGGAGPPGRS